MRYGTGNGRRLAASPQHEERTCDWPGCQSEGRFPAPRSRTELRRFRWFCLEHVRCYNAAWNYYSGMTEQEVEADLRFDTVWQRPSWRLGGRAGINRGVAGRIRDHFGVFGDEPPPGRQQPPVPEHRAMMILDLTPPVTVAIVKARYKQLVKRHHPDANGGDKASEERFKEISEAYRMVMDSLSV